MDVGLSSHCWRSPRSTSPRLSERAHIFGSSPSKPPRCSCRCPSCSTRTTRARSSWSSCSLAFAIAFVLVFFDAVARAVRERDGLYGAAARVVSRGSLAKPPPTPRNAGVCPSADGSAPSAGVMGARARSGLELEAEAEERRER